MNTTAIISSVLIVCYMAYFFILLMLLHWKYDVFLKLKLKEDPKYIEKVGIIPLGEGGWVGATFYFRPPLPIDDNSKNAKIQDAVAAHNQFIKVFWYSALGLIPIIFVLNVMNS